MTMRRVVKRPGRPRLGPEDTTVPIHFRLPARDYDKQYALARRARMTLSEWLRFCIQQSTRRG
jgi:hypothetical protein